MRVRRKNGIHKYKSYQYRGFEVRALNKDEAVRFLNKRYNLKLRSTCSYNYKDLLIIEEKND
jgi:hypothetical protein